MKLAAFDFDGTIIFRHGIDAGAVGAIRAWQDAGHLAVAATGKSLSATRYALQGSDVAFDYSVLYTGAVVADGRGSVLHSSALDAGTVRQVVEGLAGVDGIAVYGTMLEGRDTRFSSTVPSDLETTILRDYRELKAHEIDLHEFIGIPIWVPGDDDLRLRVHSWVLDTFAVECVINQDFVDIVPAGTTKGAGLQWLVDHLGLSRDDLEVYTFGDSWNDLSMHSMADRSFSFPWSPDDVQAATHEVIESVAGTLPQLLAR